MHYLLFYMGVNSVFSRKEECGLRTLGDLVLSVIQYSTQVGGNIRKRKINSLH
jgi:hypothetical protein